MQGVIQGAQAVGTALQVASTLANLADDDKPQAQAQPSPQQLQQQSNDSALNADRIYRDTREAIIQNPQLLDYGAQGAQAAKGFLEKVNVLAPIQALAAGDFSAAADLVYNEAQTYPDYLKAEESKQAQHQRELKRYERDVALAERDIGQAQAEGEARQAYKAYEKARIDKDIKTLGILGDIEKEKLEQEKLATQYGRYAVGNPRLYGEYKAGKSNLMGTSNREDLLSGLAPVGTGGYTVFEPAPSYSPGFKSSSSAPIPQIGQAIMDNRMRAAKEKRARETHESILAERRSKEERRKDKYKKEAEAKEERREQVHEKRAKHREFRSMQKETAHLRDIESLGLKDLYRLRKDLSNQKVRIDAARLEGKVLSPKDERFLSIYSDKINDLNSRIKDMGGKQSGIPPTKKRSKKRQMAEMAPLSRGSLKK